MEGLKDCILEFNPGTLEAVRKLYNFEKPEDVNKAVDILEEWVKKQNHFVKKDFPREYLERIIMAAKGSLERAKQRLDKLCTLRTLMPQFFEDFDSATDFKEFNTEITQVILPKMTDDYNRIYFTRNIGQTFENTLCLNFMKILLQFAEYEISRDYFNSIIVVIDYLETNMTELIKKMNLIEVRQGVTMVTEGYGMRIKGIHVLSRSKTIEVLITMFKQVFSQKIGQRIHVHKSIEELHDFIPKDILPIEYGGKEKSLMMLKDDWLDVLNSKEFKDYYKHMSEAKTDESFRQKDEYNEQYMGMPGSFRTLNVD